MTLNIEAVEAGLPVSFPKLPPVVDMGLDVNPGDLNVLTQPHRSLLA
jgi:hypothetical protein